MTRFLLVAGAAFGAAVIAALGLTIVDLYLTGHSLPSLGQEFLLVPGLGIASSVSDLLMLAAAVAAGAAAWWASSPRGGR